MNTRFGFALRRVGLIFGSVIALFVVFHERVRAFEADVAVAMVRGVGGHVESLSDHSILVRPANGQLFRVIVTPSCSALPSVLAIACLALISIRAPRVRLLSALAAAIATIVVGNLLRITSSLGMGLLYGQSSLVLFHDAAGSVFSFVYTLGGYMLMLWILLPAPERTPTLAHV